MENKVRILEFELTGADGGMKAEIRLEKTFTMLLQNLWETDIWKQSRNWWMHLQMLQLSFHGVWII